MEINKERLITEEIVPNSMNGMFMLLLNLALMLFSAFLFIFSVGSLDGPLQVVMIIISILYFFIIGPILFAGLKVLKPNEALVLTLFGKYYGTLKGEGFYFVNPFVTAVNPASNTATTAAFSVEGSTDKKNPDLNIKLRTKKISLKTMTLNNEKQKINDLLGNPISIGIVVVWRVVNTAKAVFNVDNYTEYLSIQCDSALRNIVRLYPYDTFGDDNEKTLRGSSLEIANKLKEEIQEKVEQGIETDGSSTGFLYLDKAELETEFRYIFRLGALGAGSLRNLIRGVVLKGKILTLYSEYKITVQMSFENRIEETEHGFNVYFTRETAEEIAAKIEPKAQMIILENFEGFDIIIEKSYIRDRYGKIVEVVG